MIFFYLFFQIILKIKKIWYIIIRNKTSEGINLDKKKILICLVACIAALAVGITIGFFIGKDAAQDVSVEITTTTEESTEAPSENESEAEEETTEETTQEETTEETTKAAKYTEVSEIVYATTGVNVRAGAGTSATIIGGLKKGERIKRTAIGDNGWSRVSYNGKTAYVYSAYLTKNSPESNGVDMCGLSNTDANNLTYLLEYLFFYGMESYDYKAKDAFENALSIIHGAPYYNLYERVDEIYRMRYEESVIFPLGNEDDITDPRGYWTQFRYVEAEYIDFILENMFNVKPDHEHILYIIGWVSEGKDVYAYYQDGYYYSYAGDGGDGVGPEVTVKKVEILPDGKYKVTVHYRIVEAEDVTFIDGGDLNVVAEMKNIDGNSIWSFYEIEPVK